MIRIQGMFGLGDNIYQRAVIRDLGPLQLVTPWPQLYADLRDVECLQGASVLRTQEKNRRTVLEWAQAKPADVRFEMSYDQILPGSIIQRMLDRVRQGNQQKLKFDLPKPDPNLYHYWDRTVIVRPVTVRREWPARSRNPLPEYIAQAAQRAMQAGFHVVCVADLADGEEWLEGPLPPANQTYLNGLPFDLLLALVQRAKGLIGGVGWLVPAAMAARVPMLLVYGGWGGDNGPQRIFDKRVPHDNIVEAMPDNFCGCSDKDHHCDKTISNFRRYVDVFIEQIHRP